MPNYYNFILLGTVLATSGCLCPDPHKLDKLHINDVFHKLPQHFKADDVQAAMDRKQAVDMSKISHAMLNATIRHIQTVHQASTGYNASIIEDVNERAINDTEIQIFNKTRRALPWHGRFDPYWDYAYDYKARQKMWDCMLTLIYMARHHVLAMTLRGSTRRDSSYRMAYLWSKILILHSKIETIYNTMRKKANITNWDLKKKKYVMMLHKKALKTHTQFNFYYFMIARIHHNLVDESNKSTLVAKTKQKKTISSFKIKKQHIA